MPAPMTKAKRDALFAALIVQHHDSLFPGRFGETHYRYYAYCDFLRAQADTRHGNVYAMALKQMGLA